MTEQSLFPENIDERIERLDAEILSLLIGKPGGPQGLTLSDSEKQVLRVVRFCRGAARAVTIKDMRAFMDCDLTEREIKQAVRTLRINFGVHIGSSKMGSGGGYFLMITNEDRAILNAQIMGQIRAEFDVLKAMNKPHEVLELLGQLQLEIGATAPEAA